MKRLSDLALWVGLSLLALVMACGCSVTAHTAKLDSSIPVAGSSVEKAGAHVESAERLVKAAKPNANPTGQALLGSASEEHKAALSALNDTRAQLAKATKERDTLSGDNVKLAATITEVTGGWGYKLQLFCRRAEWLLIGLVSLHYILAGASLFAPVGWAGLLAKIAALINPLSWAQAVATHSVAVRSVAAPTG